MKTAQNPHPRVAAAGAEISQHLAEIATLYNRDMKLTLLIRDPSHLDGTRDMVVSNDELADVIAALQIRQAPR